MWRRLVCVMLPALVASACGQAAEPKDRLSIVIVEGDAQPEESGGAPAQSDEISTAFDGIAGDTSETADGDATSSDDSPELEDQTSTEPPPDDDTASPDSSSDGQWTIVPRDLETECLVLGDYLYACGQFSDRVYEQYVAICTSNTVSPGMKAGTIACSAQLSCDDTEIPQCFQDGIEPECDTDTDCGDGVCVDQVCHELVWTEGSGGGGGGGGGGGTTAPPEESCLHVGYSSGAGNVTLEVVVGSYCANQSQCGSGRCVYAESHDDPTLDQSWCANKGDCRTPNNADEACPAGFTCTEVLEYVIEENPRWLCVPDTIEVCAPLF